MLFEKLKFFFQQYFFINLNKLVVNYDEILSILKKDINLLTNKFINIIYFFDLIKFWVFYLYLIFLLAYYYYYPELHCKRDFIRIYGGWQSLVDTAYMWNKPVFSMYERIEHSFYLKDDIEDEEEIFFLYDLVLGTEIINKFNFLTISRSTNIFSKKFLKTNLYFLNFNLRNINWFFFCVKTKNWILFDLKENLRNIKPLFCTSYIQKRFLFSEYYRYNFMHNLFIYYKFLISFEQLKINDYIKGDWLPEKPSVFFNYPKVHEGISSYSLIFSETILPLKIIENYSKKIFLSRKRPYLVKYNIKSNNIKELSLCRGILISFSYFYYFKKFFLNKNINLFNNIDISDWLSYNILTKGIHNYKTNSITFNLSINKLSSFKYFFRFKKWIKYSRIRHKVSQESEIMDFLEYEELNQLAKDWFPFKSGYIKFK